MANGQDSWGFFKNAHDFGRLNAAGSRAGFTSSRPPPRTMDLDILISLIFVQCVTLRNLDLLIKTGWSVICPLCCWERWSWVGDNNPSRSRVLSIWSKEVWWTVLTLLLVGAIAYRVALLFVAIWIPVGLRSGWSPWCDPLTFVPLCDHKRDWHLTGLCLNCCVAVVSSVARTIRWMCESSSTTTTAQKV